MTRVGKITVGLDLVSMHEGQLLLAKTQFIFDQFYELLLWFVD